MANKQISFLLIFPALIASVCFGREIEPLHPAASASIAAHRAACAGKDGWSDPAPPVQIFANVFDVGTCGITVLLVTGAKGHVLIDAATDKAAASIIANIERLGYRLSDIKLLLSSHEHVDHAGGLAALREAIGGQMVATAAERPMLESGMASIDDPQRGAISSFSGVPVDRVVRDGEVVRLGSLSFTAHATPGHSPGSTSWTWRSCDRTLCRSIAYADSVSAVSADTYRFTDHANYVAAFRQSLDKMAAFRCDLLITPHPGASNLYERLAGELPLTSANACQTYAANGRAKLDDRLIRERGSS